MNISKIIVIAVSLALAAAGTGQLPKVIATVRRAQVQLIQESKTIRWGRASQLR